MRLACGGFFHESNSYCPTPTTLEIYQHGLLRGEAMVDAYREAHHEMGGFLSQTDDVDRVAVLMANAAPSGKVTEHAYETIAAELIDGLVAAEADGIYLALHGAMVTEHLDDGEGELLRRLRERIGPGLPVVVSLDYHANISPAMVRHADALVVYRTYPHLDQRARGEESARLLKRLAAGEAKAVQALVAPPLILNLKAQETSREPLLSILAVADDIAARPGILSVSVAGGFPYADILIMGSTGVVVADGDSELAKSAAAELGEAIWAARDSAALDMPDAEEAVTQALADGPLPAVLADFGDNVGGGSSADGPLLLRELLAQGATGSVVTFWAPDAVQQCIAAGVGATVSLSVGGTTEDGQGPPLDVTGQVRGLFDGDYEEPEPRHGGARYLTQGLTAVVALEGDNLLVLTTLRPSPNSLNQLRSVGIEPTTRRVCVCKGAIAYKAAYEPIAGRIIEVDTPGFTAVNPARFAYHHRRVPMLPFEPVEGPSVGVESWVTLG